MSVIKRSVVAGNAAGEIDDQYRGQWNAATNLTDQGVTLPNPPTAPEYQVGDWWQVSTAGTQFSLTFTVGDELYVVASGGALAWAKRDGGNGDVVGPSSSTLNALAVYSDTTGKAIKNSGVTVSGASLDILIATAFASSGTVADAGLLRGTNNSTLIAARNAANTANISLSVNSSDQFSSTGKFLVSPAAASSGSTPYLHIVAASDTGLTASTEVPLLYVQSNAANRTWAAGAITNQRTVLINRSTYITSGVSTWTNVAVLGISGYSSSNSANLTITNSHGILVSTASLTNTTNSYGLTINAATGATNNYAAQFIGGNTGFGVAAPLAITHAASSTSAGVALHERSGQSSDAAFTASRVLVTRSGTYGNSFGSLLAFSAQDAGAVINDIGYVGAYSTNSSQTTGNVEISSVSAGSRTVVATFAYDKSTTLTGLLTANSTGVSGTSTIYGNSGSAVTITNTSQPYSGSSGDIQLKIATGSTSNTGAGLTLVPNYLTSNIGGWNFNTRYGNNGSYRTNADLMISQYLTDNPSGGAPVNAWESRIYCDYSRTIRFSTTGSGTNDVTFAPTAATFLMKGVFSPVAVTSGTSTALTITPAADTGMTASTEVPALVINSSTRQWATGALTIQRSFKINQPTFAFVGASTLTDAATIGVVGAPVGGTNATITNSHGILVSAGALSNTTNGYGLTVNAPTGATNNYCAQFLGGRVSIGTSAPSASALLELSSTTQGLRLPNMTTAQKNAISSPVAGLKVFDTTLAKECVYTGAAWETITSI